MINSSGQLGPSSTNLFWTNLFAGTNIVLIRGTNGEVTINGNTSSNVVVLGTFEVDGSSTFGGNIVSTGKITVLSLLIPNLATVSRAAVIGPDGGVSNSVVTITELALLSGKTSVAQNSITNGLISIQSGKGNNNIFTNLSTVGTSGLQVGLQSSDSSLWMWDDAAGAAKRIVYYDGSGEQAIFPDIYLFSGTVAFSGVPSFGSGNLNSWSAIATGTKMDSTNGQGTNITIRGNGGGSANVLLQGNGGNNSGTDFLLVQGPGGVTDKIGSNGVVFSSGITNNGTLDSSGLIQAFTGLNSYTNLSVNDKGNNSNRIQLLTGKQGLTIDNTNDDAGNYERGFARWNNNVFNVGTEKAGTGASRTLQLNAVSKGVLATSGNASFNWDSSEFYPASDASLDLGVNGAGGSVTRFRDLLISRNITGGYETSDTSTKTNLFIGGSSYPGSTSVVNGGQLILSGGLSPSRIAVTNWNNFTNSIITNVIVTVDGTFTQFLTNGAAVGMWTNGADMSTCATNIATNCNSKVFFGTSIAMSTYVTVSAFQSNVLFFPLAKCLSITTGSVTNGATNLSSTANQIILAPQGVNNSIVNIGTTGSAGSGTMLNIGGVVNSTATFVAGTGSGLQSSGRSRIECPSDGIWNLSNAGRNGFIRLIFCTNSTASGYPTMAPSISITNNSDLFITDQAGVIQSSNTLGAASIVLPASTANPTPSLAFAGAHLFSDGTNLLVTFKNAGGVRTTNKLTMTAWP